MDRIVRRAESRSTTPSGARPWVFNRSLVPVHSRRALPRDHRSRWRAAMEERAVAIVACTRSGMTARAISRFRPPMPIIAITPVNQRLVNFVVRGRTGGFHFVIHGYRRFV